jgi:hypothetical protein
MCVVVCVYVGVLCGVFVCTCGIHVCVRACACVCVMRECLVEDSETKNTFPSA